MTEVKKKIISLSCSRRDTIQKHIRLNSQLKKLRFQGIGIGSNTDMHHLPQVSPMSSPFYLSLWVNAISLKDPIFIRPSGKNALLPLESV